MDIRSLKNRIDTVAAKVPPPPGRPMVQVFAARGPRPADAPPDTKTCLRWYHRDLAELAELRAKFDREFGPDTRAPNDLPCMFIRLISQQEIFDEQYKGGPYESLWLRTGGEVLS